LQQVPVAWDKQAGRQEIQIARGCARLRSRTSLRDCSTGDISLSAAAFSDSASSAA
jgi:hypothetical protein